MNWKYWVIRKMKPSSVKKATVTEAHAAAKRGLRNSDTSSIGSRVRRSREMNAASRVIASAKPTSVRTLLQPWLGASMIVKISRAIETVESPNPGRSSAGACGSRDVGPVAAISAPAAIATGVIAKKMLGQEKRSRSHPPTIGPSAIAIPAVAPHNPIARARSARPVNTFVMSDSVAGNTIAAPSPIRQRAAISCAASEVSPPAALARPNTPEPPPPATLPRPGAPPPRPPGGPNGPGPRQQHSLAPEPVGEASRREQERCEHEVVGVDDPLELAVGRVQLAHQRGQRDVDDRRVEVDRKRGEEEGREDEGTSAHRRKK